MKLILLLLSLLSLLFSHELSLSDSEMQWIKKNQDILFTGDPNWLPFEAFDKEGKYIGIVSDHLKLVEKRTGLNFIPLVVKDWTESLDIASQGKVSMISGDAADKTLNKGFRPIEPYFISPIIIVMNYKANYVEDLNILQDKKVAIIKGYGYTADLFLHYPNMKFIEVSNIQRALRGVNDGEFDAMLASSSLASYSISKMGFEHLKIVGKTNVVMEVTLFVDKKKPILYTIINKAIKSISTNKHNAIIKKWTTSSADKRIYTILGWGIALLSLTLLLSIVFMYRSEYKNKKRHDYMKKLVSAQELGHMGSWEWDMLSGELIWSDEVYRIFGEEPQSFPATYEAFKSYIPKEYHVDLESAIDGALKNHTTYEFDHTILRKNGEVRSVREAGYIRYNEKAEPTSMLGTILDINSIQKAKTTLQENKELTDLLQKFDENVIASNTDLKGNITYASSAFVQISGFSQDELMREPQNIVRHEETSKAVFKELWETIQSGKTWKGILKNKKKSGEVYWVDSTISPIYNENKEISGYSAIRRDITHAKRVEELHTTLEIKSSELQKLNNELEERIKDAVSQSKEKDHLMAQQSKLASMGEMIGNIAHQWRQPLNALSLLLQKQQILYEKGILTPKIVEESTEKGTMLINKMSTTIDDFRNFFKPDKKKHNFDVKDIVERTLELVHVSLYNQNIKLTLDIQEGQQLYGYENEFSQVILNIINNAKDALLDENTQDGQILISSTLEDNEIEICIQDNAGGVPEENIEKIFEPYFTTKEEGKGTGIGLYMSKMIIEENMQGKINVHNTPTGAIFCIIMPLSSKDNK